MPKNAGKSAESPTVQIAGPGRAPPSYKNYLRAGNLAVLKSVLLQKD